MSTTIAVKTKQRVKKDFTVYNELAMRQNSFVLEYSRTSMSALSGAAAGILGLTGLYGFIFFFIMAFVLSVFFIIAESWIKLEQILSIKKGVIPEWTVWWTIYICAILDVSFSVRNMYVMNDFLQAHSEGNLWLPLGFIQDHSHETNMKYLLTMESQLVLKWNIQVPTENQNGTKVLNGYNLFQSDWSPDLNINV